MKVGAVGEGRWANQPSFRMVPSLYLPEMEHLIRNTVGEIKD